MTPTVFVSHGPPTLVLEPSPVREFLSGLGAALGRPAGILCVSAHWDTGRPAVSTAPAPETIHDFYGFPEPLYAMTYPAPGAPELAERASRLLDGAGLAADRDPGRGLDHGAWVPLRLMYPDPAIPVAQISIQAALGPAHHLAVGRALAPLRADGILVLASGNTTHNLHDAIGAMRSGAVDAPPPAWARSFADWLSAAVADGNEDDLVNYRARAPFAALAHPTDEHLLPLHVAFGAAGPGARGRRLHESYLFRSLNMAAYAFDA
jgi:4,5-DOPA dioxygenase extradiol